VKKSEKPRFYGQNKLFFENLAIQPLGSFSHMAAYKVAEVKRARIRSFGASEARFACTEVGTLLANQ
jgi:hypothetical protein